MISSPQTYAEWVNVLNILKEKTDDSAALQAMQTGRLAWQSGVAERFVKRFIDVINSRINGVVDTFQKDISRAGGNENSIVQAILKIRKEMQFLGQVGNLSVFPDEQRNQILSLIREQADMMQQSLEDSAKSDRSGRLSSIVRNNRINSL